MRVRTDAWVAAGEARKAIGFDYFCFLSAIDWMPSPFGKGEDDPTEPPPERETTIRPGRVRRRHPLPAARPAVQLDAPRSA